MKPCDVFKNYNTNKLTGEDAKIFHEYYNKECVAYYLRKNIAGITQAYIIIKIEDDMFCCYEKFYRSEGEYTNSIPHTVVRLE